MNRKEFMYGLKKGLGLQDEALKSEIINDYEEYFEHGIREGKTEEDLCREIGTPEQVIENLYEQGVLNRERKTNSSSFKKEYSNSEYNKSKHNKNYNSKSEYNALGIVGLVVLNLALISFIVVPVGGTILGIGVGSIFGILPVTFASLICLFMGIWFPFFVTLTIAAFMGLIIIALYFLCKWGYYFLLKYINWNKKIARGE